jgi:hypothetical protein
MMDTKIKKQWVKALRSGEYNQTSMALARTEDGETITGFCCLGVLAHECVPEPWERTDHPWYPEELTLPRELKTFEELGLDRRTHGILTTMNDEGKTFDEIADWIEENL